MKIFICWSKENSKKIALAFKEFLKCVLSPIETFISEDIQSGEVWMNKISQELQENDFGVLIITPENMDSKWIHFEAGALYKGDNSNRIIPLCFGIKISELDSPISKYFTGRNYEKEDFNKLIDDLAENLDYPLEAEQPPIKTYFEKFWPDFKAKVDIIVKKFEIDEKEDQFDLLTREIITNRNIIYKVTNLLENPNTIIKTRKLMSPIKDKIVDVIDLMLKAYFYDDLRKDLKIKKQEFYELQFLSNLDRIIKENDLESLDQGWGKYIKGQMVTLIQQSEKTQKVEEKAKVELKPPPM